MGARQAAGGLVLAAGASHRFGGDKLFASFRGRALLAHVLEVASEARRLGLLSALHVVTSAGNAGVAALARESGAEVVANPDPSRGLSSSLRLGLAALPHDVRGALILLGDQPLVRLDVVEALVRAWQESGGRVVRPRYIGAPAVPGHPVLLDRAAWPLADRLEGDSGLASLFPPGATAVTLLDVPGQNPDVDTPADLLSLKDYRP